MRQSGGQVTGEGGLFVSGVLPQRHIPTSKQISPSNSNLIPNAFLLCLEQGFYPAERRPQFDSCRCSVEHRLAL